MREGERRRKEGSKGGRGSAGKGGWSKRRKEWRKEG